MTIFRTIRGYKYVAWKKCSKCLFPLFRNINCHRVRLRLYVFADAACVRTDNDDLRLRAFGLNHVTHQPSLVICTGRLWNCATWIGQSTHLLLSLGKGGHNRQVDLIHMKTTRKVGAESRMRPFGFFFAWIFFGRWGTSLSAYFHPIVLCVQNAIISSMVRAIPSLMQGLGIPNHRLFSSSAVFAFKCSGVLSSKRNASAYFCIF